MYTYGLYVVESFKSDTILCTDYVKIYNNNMLLNIKLRWI